MAPTRSATSSMPASTGSTRNHQHRPAALDGLRRRPGLRDDQRAHQGDQGGGGREALSHQLWRKQDLQYVGDVADDVRAGLERPFEGADAFNLSGAVEPIESFVEALCDVCPTRATWSRTATGSSRSRRTSTTPGCRRPGTDPDDPAPRRDRRDLPPLYTPARPGSSGFLGSLIADRWIDRARSGLRRGCSSSGGACAAPRGAAGSEGNMSLGIGLTSILASFRSSSPFLLEIGAKALDDIGPVLLESGSLPSLRSVTWIRCRPNGVSTGVRLPLPQLECRRRRTPRRSQPSIRN